MRYRIRIELLNDNNHPIAQSENELQLEMLHRMNLPQEDVIRMFSQQIAQQWLNMNLTPEPPRDNSILVTWDKFKKDTVDKSQVSSVLGDIFIDYKLS